MLPSHTPRCTPTRQVQDSVAARTNSIPGLFARPSGVRQWRAAGYFSLWRSECTAIYAVRSDQLSVRQNGERRHSDRRDPGQAAARAVALRRTTLADISRRERSAALRQRTLRSEEHTSEL